MSVKAPKSGGLNKEGENVGVNILATIGTFFAIVGAVTAIAMADLGPNWYPIMLAVTSFPSVWAGGRPQQGLMRPA